MAINTYELLKKRLQANGGNQEGRMRQGKLKTLLKALQYSEQAETVIKDGETHRVILNKNKQKMDYDDKNISVPFEAGFKVGDIFHWVEDNSDWIIYLKEGQDAYFTGVCRKAIYDVRWKDEYNVYHTCKAAVRGPVETKIVGEFKSGIAFDKPNYTLYCLLPRNEETIKLKRYSRVSIEERVWEVAVVDSISEPGIVEVQLLEDYKNAIEDEDLVKPSEGQCEFIPSESVKISSPLDDIDEIQIYEPFHLWMNVEKDGKTDKEISESAEFTVKGKASLVDNLLTPLEVGPLEISVKIPKLCYEKTYSINVTDVDIPSVAEYEIFGDDKVKSFGSNEYVIKYFIDGIEVEPEQGTWEFVNNKKLFTISKNDSNSIIFNWNIGSVGNVKLQYVVNNNVVATKEIKVESLI